MECYSLVPTPLSERDVGTRLWRATVRVQHQGHGVKTTEVEACVALVCAFTNDGRPLTDVTNLKWMVFDWVASGQRAVHK